MSRLNERRSDLPYLAQDAEFRGIAEIRRIGETGDSTGARTLAVGWTVGELIRRVTGKSVGANIQELLSGPLALDLWCGLPEAIEPRVSWMIPNLPSPDQEPDEVFRTMTEDPGSIPGLFATNDGGWLSDMFAADESTVRMEPDSRASHAAEIPAANGITNARGLAGAYRPFALGGSADGKTFVGPDTLVGMEEKSAGSNRDATLLVRAGWSLGFAKSIEGVLLGRRAFGHAGPGGSIGFAEPASGMSFGYTMNKMGGTVALTERSQSLVDATYRVLGYRSNASGFWI